MAVTNRHASPVDASPSPQPQPATLTKRDVRRNRIMDRLQTMIDGFSSNQHQHYRAQLQAVQVDMTLVLRADPQDGAPLEDGGEEIRRLVESMVGPVGANGEGEADARRDYLAMAGRRYGGFVREVNDELEERDAGLTALHNNYHSSVAELERLTQQKLHQAEEEHKALSSTIRQRLIAQITKKRQHLLRDKEQLEISDSHALLLHPSHFSINNPGSPGGGQNRKTRHLRHRAASPSAGDLDSGANGLKRKRKAMEDADGNESPVPGFRPLPPPDNLGGGRSPFKDAREKNSYTQFEAPAYSLERLFTDKELALATATAQTATWKYFHQPQKAAEEPISNGNGTAVPSLDGEVLPDAPGAENAEEAAAHPTTETPAPAPAGISTSPPTGPTPAAAAAAAAAEMERSTSHQVLTRGGARANPLAALADLANVAAAQSAPVRRDPFAPQFPSYHAITRVEKTGAPAPGQLASLEAENDFQMIRASAPDADEPDIDPDDPEAESGRAMRKSLLDQALGIRNASQPYRLPLLETGPAVVGRGVERPAWTGFSQIGVFNEQRLRQAVVQGTAGLSVAGTGAGGFVGGNGGGAMAAALQGRMGAEPMSRTTSAGGSEAGEGLIGRRGRGRGL